MGQVTQRCVECSQVMTVEGLLCPACQKRLGKAPGSAQNPQSPGYEGEKVMSTGASAPVVTASPSAPANLVGVAPVAATNWTASAGLHPVGGAANPEPAVPGAAPAAGSPPSYGAPVMPTTASTADALQRAREELAMMQVRQLASGPTRDDSPWTRFPTRVGNRLLIRLTVGLLTVGSILAVGIALTRGHHRSDRSVETAAEKSHVSQAQQQAGGMPNSGPLPPAHYASGGQTTTAVQTPMPIPRPVTTGGTTERLTLQSDSQVAEDARRALDSVPGAGNPTLARNLIERARNDIAILRNSSGRLSPENQTSVLQTAQTLEERAQMLEAQVQAMQEATGQSGPGSTVNQEPQAPTLPQTDQGGQQNAPPTGEGQGGQENAGGGGLGATPAGGGNGNP